MRQTHFLQQIQRGQQMESIENEIEPGHHIEQPRVSFTESTSTQYRNLLAFLNLLEIQIMNRQRFSSNRSCPQSMLLSSSQRKHGQHVTHVMVEACLGIDHQSPCRHWPHKYDQNSACATGPTRSWRTGCRGAWDGIGRGNVRRVAQGPADEPQLVQPGPVPSNP